jgi:hypothetical protein
MDNVVNPSHGTERQRLLAQVSALKTLGFQVRVRHAGLLRLAEANEVGLRLLATAVEVLNSQREGQRRYDPFFVRGHPMEERAILEQIFPDAEPSVPVHMQALPDWLAAEPILGVT